MRTRGRTTGQPQPQQSAHAAGPADAAAHIQAPDARPNKRVIGPMQLQDVTAKEHQISHECQVLYYQPPVICPEAKQLPYPPAQLPGGRPTLPRPYWILLHGLCRRATCFARRERSVGHNFGGIKLPASKAKQEYPKFQILQNPRKQNRTRRIILLRGETVRKFKFTITANRLYVWLSKQTLDFFTSQS